MNNFINIFYRYEYPTVYDYTDYLCFYQGIMEVDTFTIITALKLSSPKSFMDFLNSDQYIYAWVDQYYITATEHYHYDHNIHPILIYGYDSISNVYYCKCFSVNKGVYKASINIDEYHCALEEAAKTNDCFNQDKFLRLFKIKDNFQYDFVLSQFIAEIYDYATGRGKYKDSYYSKNDLQLEIDNVYHHWMHNISAYGIEVTKLLSDAFKDTQIRCFDYRLLHLVCENKQLIAQRLHFVCDKYRCSKKFNELVSEYHTLAKNYNNTRLYAIKFSLATKNSFFGLNYSDEIKAAFSSELYDLYIREKELLSSILYELTDLSIKNNFMQYKIIKSDILDDKLEITCKTPEFVHSIVICSYSRHFKGKLFIDNEAVEISATSSNFVYIIEVNRMVSHFYYVPERDGIEVCPNIAYAICEHRCKCQYLTSSIGWAGPNHIIADNLADYNTTLWCADEKDNNPFVEVIFDKPITADTILIEQHFMEKNISEASVQVYRDNAWQDLLPLVNMEGIQILKCNFHEVKSNRYRLQILKTNMHANGSQKVPCLMLLKIYKETLN